MENKVARAFYKFQTSAALIEIAKTKEYIEQLKLGGVSLAQIDEVKKSNEKLSKDDLLRKFSDKRVKKTSSAIKKPKKEKAEGSSGRKKSSFGSALYRYYVPLLFLSAEGKTVIRKCRVLNVKDDKKYDTLSKNGWEVQYGQMLPLLIQVEDGHMRVKKNGIFNQEQFQLCGGLTNSKFWDINLRYAQVSSPIVDDDETFAYILAHLNKWVQALPEEVTRIARHESKPEQQQQQLE